MGITEANELFQEYATIFETVFMNPIIFVILMIIILVIGYVRYRTLLELGLATTRSKKDKVLYKQWVRVHSLIETALAIITSYTVIKSTGAKVSNAALNWIISPLIGFVAAILIDNNVFIKFESDNGGVIPKFFKPSTPKASSSSDKKNDGSSTTVNITNNFDAVGMKGTPTSLSPTGTCTDRISSDVLERDDAGKVLADTLNATNAKLDELSKKCDTIAHNIEDDRATLEVVRSTMATDTRKELKSNILDALDQGYVKPHDNKNIIGLRKKYRELTRCTSDEEIDGLFAKYSTLDVHNDRRHRVAHVDYDRRKK